MAGPLHIGVDVGGTKVLAVATAASEPGRVLAAAEYPTAPGTAVLDVIERAIHDVAARLAAPDGAPARPRAIGVGMPGLVTRGGVLRYGPHLPGADELDVATWLAARHGVPVAVDNDGNCAAWAEQVLGVGAGHDHLVFVGLGTGISCGLVVEGRRVRGVHGFAGEAGHMTIAPDGPRCACGRTGCWEALASGSALAAQARAAARGGASALVELAGGDPDAVRGEHVTAALRAGDPAALEVAERFSRWVALGVANLVHLLDPAVVALGGSVVDPTAPWMSLIAAAYDAEVLAGPLRPRTEVLPARLGREAGAVGAALIAAELVPNRHGPDV